MVSEGERRQLTLTETAAKKANKQGAPTEQEVGRAHIGDGNCKPVPTTTRASFVTYNTEGLSRLHEPDACAYLADFDFCLLVETFSKTFPSLLFPLHDVFIVPGVKLTDAVTARLSGCMVLLVRKELGKYIEQITVE